MVLSKFGVTVHTPYSRDIYGGSKSVNVAYLNTLKNKIKITSAFKQNLNICICKRVDDILRQERKSYFFPS